MAMICMTSRNNWAETGKPADEAFILDSRMLDTVGHEMLVDLYEREIDSDNVPDITQLYKMWDIRLFLLDTLVDYVCVPPTAGKVTLCKEL